MRALTFALALLSTLPFTQAKAFDFAISNFTVQLNGGTIFTDSFTNTTPPKAPNFSNGNTASYTLPAGSFSPAVNGKLHLNSASATISPAVSSRLGVAAHLNSNTDPKNTTTGLKPGSSFRVSGIWDATAPADVKEAYFIELSDWSNGVCDACIRLGIAKNADGTVEVQFWTNKIANNEILDKTILGKATFDPGTNQQIRFTLKKDSPTTNEVRASYAYIKDGVVGAENELAGQANVFSARGYAIAAFKAFAPAAYGKATGTNSGRSLNCNINVGNAHAGKNGNIYVVALYKGALFANNGTSWVTWDTNATLPAYMSNVSLADRSINVLDKLDVSSLIGTTIYVGYGIDQNDLLSSQTFDLVHTVE